MEQKNKGRARVKIAVFFVLAIHGIGLLALLMQGCRRDEGAGAGAGGGSAAPTNVVAAPTFENTNLAVAEPPAATNAGPVTPVAPVPPPGGATDYKVVKGDTLGTIATHHKVTLKALMDANAGVDPAKLQIGQTIHIPAPAPVTTTGNNGGTPVADLASGEKIYVVKSGDSLTKIAASQGTTVVKLRAANGLKTDAIKVGQKLKIPAGSTPAPATGTNGTTPTTP